MRKKIILTAIIPIFALANYVSRANSDSQSAFSFYERDSDNWQIVKEGQKGKIKFDSDNFVFSASGLAQAEYTLLRYDRYSAENSAVCLARGEASKKDGKINLSGKFFDGGSQVWLVLSSDVDCQNQTMSFWNPSEYLFDYSTADKPNIL